MAIPGNLLSATTEMVDPNTSGWAARLNCALSLASGGRNGDGCLKLTSAAAGEMQARTFSSVPVEAGSLYWTFADASSSAQPERIGIRWLDAAGAELSVTWSLTTATASASWHRVSVAGVAPSSAARAQVLLSSTVAGAGVVHYWENVYLGLPIRYPGNLLSFNAEAGGEVDASAWAAESNATVSRIAPVSSWSASFYNAGGEQVAVTATAAGDASGECVERPPVTPGVEYVAFAYLGPATTGSATWVELRFYDETDTVLEAHRGPLAPPGTGMYRQLTSGIAPAGAVAASLAVGITGAGAGETVRTEGAFVGAVGAVPNPAIRTGNLLTWADWDFEEGVGSWAVASGPATIARSSPWGAEHVFDYYALTVSSATASGSVLRSGIYPGVTAGDNWRAETWFKVSAGGWQIAIAVRWYDDTDTYLSSSTAITFDAPTPGWWLLVDDAVAPAGATQGQVEVTLTATSGSSVMQLDRPALWQTLPREEVAAFDEQAMVQLILRELSVGHLMTVWRVTPDGGRTLVRGPEGLYDGYSIPADSLVIEDYEAPLGVPVYYVIETVAVDDSAHSHKITDTVTLTAGDPNYAWLTDPARPGVGLQVAVKTGPEWQQAIEQTVYRVRGRATPVVLADVRQSREGSLVCWTRTDQERDALRFLLSTGNVLLWRCAPGMGEPDVYVAVGEVQYPRIVTYAREEWREWTLPLTEVDMPTGGQVGSATWTVFDVVLEYDSGYDVLDRYETVFDLAIDRRS
ncbi:hypothetical protein ACFYMO_04000 [Streptomyces sp. NPDC007025]|uniref:hypothetical protein n=1 Tax=Streptomyces sp. NPDC007025 TaxID=3364771 RepID=UPI0036757664